MTNRTFNDIESFRRQTIFDLLATIERELILYSLVRCGGNQRAAARDLGVTPYTVFRRLRDLGLLGQLAQARAARRAAVLEERGRRRKARLQEFTDEPMETTA